MPSYQSWGRLPKATPSAVQRLYWRSELDDLDLGSSSGLPYGLGRSYGDSCLNDGGVLIDTSQLSRLIQFDPERGIVRAEAGLSLDRLLAVIVPRGWFLPVSPGTQFITLGGAVANLSRVVDERLLHGPGRFIPQTFARSTYAAESRTDMKPAPRRTPSSSIPWPRPGRRWVSTVTPFSVITDAALSIRSMLSMGSSSP